MTLKEFANWLLKNFPEDAVVVRTNSLAWWSAEVKELSEADLKRMFYMKKNPQKNQKPVNVPCFVLVDEKRYDY